MTNWEVEEQSTRGLELQSIKMRSFLRFHALLFIHFLNDALQSH